MTKMDLLRKINALEEELGEETRMEKQHLVNFLNHNYISKLRARKIEIALGLEDGYISQFVGGKEHGINKLEEMLDNARNRK